jgi:hypothetical protein
MPNSYNTITLSSGSGTNTYSQTVFGPFDFDYINIGDIKFVVKVTDGSGFKWQNAPVASVDPTTKLVTLVETLFFSGVLNEARIYRSTSLSPIVDFQSGSRISESDLDTAYRQALFAAQEAVEDGAGSGTRTLQTADDIESGAITAAELATNAVETAKIKDVNVTAGKLATDAVETAKIKDLNVTAAKLAADAAETAKIKNGAVTAPKLASTLDLSSGYTLTFPPGGIVQGEVDTASKTEMEAFPEGSSGICVPATLKHHPGVAAAWGVITFDTATPALLAGYNVSSTVGEPVEDHRRITFSNAMSSVNYVVVASQDTGSNEYPPFVLNKSTSGFDLDASQTDATGFTFQFVVYGQLAS